MPKAGHGPNVLLRALGALLLIASVLVGGLWLAAEPFDSAAGAPAPTASEPAAGSTAPAPAAEPVVFTLVTAGDVLPHATVNKNASLPGGGYDYAPMMAAVQPWIENADIALCSLEVPLAPPGTQVSAYPVFGAPEQLIGSLQAVGWDGCATATNHSLDRGVAGLEHTLDIMDQVGIGHTGTGRSPAETISPQFYEVAKDGQVLTIAHLSATTFHNDFTDPSQYSASLHALDVPQIERLATEARAAGADIVLFTPHWGQEYWSDQDDLQLDIATRLAAGGTVDVVLGGHPHVPQSMEKLPGGVDGEGMWVAYSMGNFLSNQDELCCVISTATGLMVSTEITLDPATGDARVTGVSWTGSTVDTQGQQRLYPISQLVDGLRPPGLTLSDSQIRARWDDLIAQMGEANLSTVAPEPSGASVAVIPRG